MLENARILEGPAPYFDYLSSLNYEQQIAATQLAGNHLILAGPGTGKTHTLAYRTLHLINQGVDPREICLITFTRKAAKSLSERIQSLIPDIELGFIGTIHSLATHILSETNHLQTWRLIDTKDDVALIELTCKSGPIGAYNLHQIFSYYTNTRKPIDEVLTDLGFEHYIDHGTQIEQAYKFYSDTKQRLNYLTYDDLLLLPLNNPSLCDKLGFNHLMIDEFQDVTRLQVEFARSLNCDSVMAIGDDFQSIYSFRGANNELILNFDQYFEDVNVIALSANYRSTVNICAAINQVVDQTKFGYKKHVTSEFTTEDENNPISIVGGLDDSTKVIIEAINNDPRDHAILYRRSRMRSKVEQALINERIPYQIYGGLNLLDRMHIKDLLAIITLINNPHDFISHLHVLRINDEMTEEQAVAAIEGLSATKVNDIITAPLLEYRLRTIDQTIDLAIDYYQTNVSANPNDKMINEDFTIIRNLAHGYTHILGFINEFTLDYKIDFQSNTEQAPRVILSTIHASKGLEFDNVHLLYGFNMFKDMNLLQVEEEARLFYVAMSRAKFNLTIYDNYSRGRSLNDMINDFIDSPLRENYELHYDDEDISDVEKVTLHLDQDDLEVEDNFEITHMLNFKNIIDYFRKF